MKMSTLQMISIFCILAMGFLTVPPGVQTADAHGDAHEYKVKVKVVQVKVCQLCGSAVAYRVLGHVIVTRKHKDGGSHSTHGLMHIYVPGPKICSNCAGSVA